MHGRARERGRLLRRGRSLASCAPPLQLVVRARLAGRAVAFQPAMRARLAGRAAAFQLVMRAGVAVHAVAFQLAVRARVAGRAVAFHVLVRTGVAVRAVAFQLAMRARVAGRAVVFPLAVHATLASRHRLARAPRARAREKVSSLPTEAVSWLFFLGDVKSPPRKSRAIGLVRARLSRELSQALLEPIFGQFDITTRQTMATSSKNPNADDRGPPDQSFVSHGTKWKKIPWMAPPARRSSGPELTGGHTGTSRGHSPVTTSSHEKVRPFLESSRRALHGMGWHGSRSSPKLS